MESLIEENVSLRAYNTFGVELVARYFIKVTNETMLIDLFKYLETYCIQRIFILGGGTNILFVDNYFDGLVIHMDIKGLTVVSDDTHRKKVIVNVAAGEVWMNLVYFALSKGYRNLEHLAGIPGTLGGAVVQNIGAYGYELKDFLLKCKVYDIETSCFMTFKKDMCKFDYRSSLFKHVNRNKSLRYIITEVCIELSQSERGPFDSESVTLIRQILRQRNRNLPNPWMQMGNAGSFFMNPILKKKDYAKLCDIENKEIPYRVVNNDEVRVPAGWFIEKCGWRGKTDKTVGVWHQHANVIVNINAARGLEIWKLAKTIQTNVHKYFDVHISPEVFIIRLYSHEGIVQKTKAEIKKTDQSRIKHNIHTISIPADKNACVNVLFASIGFRRPILFSKLIVNDVADDVTRIFSWIDKYHVADLDFRHENGHQSLKIEPNYECVIDLPTASFSRASIVMSGSLLLQQGYVRCVNIGGCQFTTRPIDLHLKLLIALGAKTNDDRIYRLEKRWHEGQQYFEYDCRSANGVSSVGVTVNAIVSCCMLPSNVRCKLTNIALEMSVQTVIQLARQYRQIDIIESNRTLMFERSDGISPPDQLIVYHLPIDQNYLFTMCSLAAMLRFKLLVSNFEYDPWITEYLKKLMPVHIDSSKKHAMFDGTLGYHDDEFQKLVCDVYPNGMPTDIAPMLCALLIAKDVSFEIVDHIYDKRSTHCHEFEKLGYRLTHIDNTTKYERIRDPQITNHILTAHDIRCGAAILILSLYCVNMDVKNENRTIIIQQYEQIERGYGYLLQRQLRDLGFSIRIISNG